jgi:hypothetical protein
MAPQQPRAEAHDPRLDGREAVDPRAREWSRAHNLEEVHDGTVSQRDPARGRQVDGNGQESAFYAATLTHDGLDRSLLVDVNRVLHGAAAQFIEMGGAGGADLSFGSSRERERR